MRAWDEATLSGERSLFLTDAEIAELEAGTEGVFHRGLETMKDGMSVYFIVRTRLHTHMSELTLNFEKPRALGFLNPLAHSV